MTPPAVAHRPKMQHRTFSAQKFLPIRKYKSVRKYKIRICVICKYKIRICVICKYKIRICVICKHKIRICVIYKIAQGSRHTSFPDLWESLVELCLTLTIGSCWVELLETSDHFLPQNALKYMCMCRPALQTLVLAEDRCFSTSLSFG